MSVASAPNFERHRFAGGLYMTLAMSGFIVNDTFAKLVSGSVGLGELIFIRGCFAVAIVLAIILVWVGPSGIRHAFHLRVLVRAAMDAVSTFLFITALFHMPLPNVTAILQAVPLTVTLLAATLLGEAVGWRRFTAIAIGFAGVLMIVKPGGEGFNIYAGIAICCIFVVAVRDLVTRRIPSDVPSIVVALANAAVVTVAGGIWSIFEGFSIPDPQVTLRLATSAVFLVVGYLFTVMALRTGDISDTAPFRYTIIIWSMLSGYFVFHDTPDGYAIAGMILIAASGLYAFYRERKFARPIGFGARLVR